FVLDAKGEGVYQSQPLNLPAGLNYRVRIDVNGREYRSDYTTAKVTPPIDSLTWRQDGDAIISVHAHDPSNNTRYYRWDYTEAWEFHSAYAPVLTYNLDPRAVYIYLDQRADLSKFVCYQSSKSTTIEILSTAKIARDTTHYRLLTIPRRDWKISVLYSINARQFSISKEGFEYLSKMKKNTEQTGSIFDAQPSELRGNVTCVTDPNEPVIGFIEISDVYSKRIFIRNSQVPNWGYSTGCFLSELVNNSDSIKNAGLPAPISPMLSDQTGNILRFLYSDVSCVDCTLRGSLTKPSFFP
ncbi:MAG: DUF4249 domain-containing protein, partial [Chitinophagaceae bacterium]